MGVCGARGEGRGRAGAGAGAGAQRLPCRVAGVAARGVRTRGRSASRRPNFCLRPRGRRWRGRAVRPRVTSSHVNGFLLCCRRWGGRGGRGQEGACLRAGSASAFPPAGAEHELPAPFERKRKEEKLGCNSSASGRWARGRGAAERRRLGDGGDPRLASPPPAPRSGPTTPRSPGAAAAPARTKCVLLARRRRPRGDGYRARWVSGGESARGAAWGGGGGGANPRRWGRPEPSPCWQRVVSLEPGAPGAPPQLPSARGEERERGRSERGEAR